MLQAYIGKSRFKKSRASFLLYPCLTYISISSLSLKSSRQASAMLDANGSSRPPYTSISEDGTSIAAPKFGGINFLAERVSCAAQSFLSREFSTARLDVLLNLRHAGVFQVNTMVNSGIGFQEPLTHPGVKLDEKMSICPSTPQDHGGFTNPSWLESDLRERKCHAML